MRRATATPSKSRRWSDGSVRGYDCAMTKLTRANVLAFMNRDWAASRRSKDQAVTARIAAEGPDRAAALAQALLDEVWPRINSEERRAEDLQHHIDLRRKLAKATRRR